MSKSLAQIKIPYAFLFSSYRVGRRLLRKLYINASKNDEIKQKRPQSIYIFLFWIPMRIQYIPY